MSRKATDATAQPKDRAPEAENLRFARSAIWSLFFGLVAITFTAFAISPALICFLGDFMIRFWQRVSEHLGVWIFLAIASGLMAVSLGKGWRDHSDTYNRSLARLGQILGIMAIVISSVLACIGFLDSFTLERRIEAQSRGNEIAAKEHYAPQKRGTC